MVAPVQGGNQGAAPAKKGGMPTWAIVLIVCVAAAPVVFGVVAAIAVYGVRKYITNAKRAEATLVTQRLAQSVINCATALDETGKPRGLPESAPAVPGDLAQIAGRKYQSSASDWSAPAYTCSSFVLKDPQYFQYAYRRVDATHGEVIAVADLDADGAPDARGSVSIDCSSDGASCSLGPFVE
jgi:type IV pilus assembly protein PilA